MAYFLSPLLDLSEVRIAPLFQNLSLILQAQLPALNRKWPQHREATKGGNASQKRRGKKRDSEWWGSFGIRG